MSQLEERKSIGFREGGKELNQKRSQSADQEAGWGDPAVRSSWQRSRGASESASALLSTLSNEKRSPLGGASSMQKLAARGDWGSVGSLRRF